MATTPQIETESGPTQKCSACQGDFAASELKQASIPPLVALAEATDIVPDDPRAPQPQLFVDTQWYCAACRHRVHWRRGAATLAMIVATAMASVIVRWLWG